MSAPDPSETVLFDYWRSSAAYRVRIALNLAGIAYRAVPVNIAAGEQRLPENLARNPQGLVPTLAIDGLTLTQSVAILDYLEDTRGPIFLPADPAGRARVRALAHAIAMEIAPVANLSVRRRVAELSDGRITPEGWANEVMERGLTALERMLDHPATGIFCHGDSVTQADICLVPQIYNARRGGLDLARWPRILRISAALDALPGVAAAHPDRHIPEGATP
ncbi:MAG: maleylacetoacetate isomerase [Paracoccaceae bacterium]|nr:MAG: maleylacetoacetate isomerase [Paracoccaceae bacterium]